MENKKDLKNRTKDFALRIIRMHTSLPQSPEAKVIGTQILRSGTRVGVKYREASQGRSKTDFADKVKECLRELDVTTYWFELLSEGNILAENRLIGLLQESKELKAIFAAMIKNVKTGGKKK
jgi:four helix bundle protein